MSRHSSWPGPESAAPGTVLGRLAVRPWLALAIAVGAALAVFLRQELFVVRWLLFVGFFAYLVCRFVRVHERLAVAAEQVAADAE